MQRSTLTIAVAAIMGCALPQRVDPAFQPMITQPAYAPDSGPVVWIDHAHNNIVGTSGRYTPFFATLRADGHVVRALRTAFTPEALADVRLLVIGNALHESNVKDGSLPNPSAFTPPEIEAVHDWVQDGGALLLLADHMPSAGAAADLAAAFGVEYLNGYVEDPDTWNAAVFRRSEGSLASHEITNGLSPEDRVSAVGTFDGSAFRAPEADALMVLDSRYVSYHPQKAWDIDADTPYQSVEGWLQGAALHVGQGRLAVFADATMFSAQFRQNSKTRRLGMNTPVGAENLQLLRNVMHWLAGRMPTS